MYVVVFYKFVLISECGRAVEEPTYITGVVDAKGPLNHKAERLGCWGRTLDGV